MTLDLILPLIAAFVLGAVSPGPSLAVVLRNSLSGGRRQGVLAGLGHGLGFGVYAFLSAVGISAAIARFATARQSQVIIVLEIFFMFAVIIVSSLFFGCSVVLSG